MMLNEIESIELLYPSLMSDDAAEEIKSAIVEADEIDSEISRLFVKSEELRNKATQLRSFLSKLSGLYKIHYKAIEKEDKQFDGDAIEAPMIVESTGIVHV